MTEYVTPDGEVLEIGSKTPYQIACSELVAFKLKTLETVAADPRLREASCTEAMIVYLSFLTIDKNTLKPKSVYASANKLMARGKMKSKTTAKKARLLLVDTGYLRKTGETKNGCTRYLVENPNAERVKMHIKDAEDYLADLDINRKREERRRKKTVSASGVPTNAPPENDRGTNQWPDGVPTNGPNYHRGIHRGSCSEGSDDSLGMTIPFAVPDSEAEVEEILSHASTTNPTILTVLRTKLMNGELTPFLLLYDFQEAAQ